MKSRQWALLENRLGHFQQANSFFFTNPVQEWRAWDKSSLISCFAEMESASHQGLYLVGYLAYEAYLYLNTEGRLTAPQLLLHFLAYDSLSILSQDEVLHLFPPMQEFRISNLKLVMSKHDYLAGYHRIRQHIMDGDTYQTNFTNKYQFDFVGDPVSFYQYLRAKQKVAYGGFLQFDDYQILSCSPELFLQKTGDLLTTKPMKGTMPRSEDLTLDRLHRDELVNSEKLTAENLMIVDLLRNDLSAISISGSVVVPKLLEIESYQTLHQMTSTIQSQLRPNLSFQDIMRAMFPCGSITGAPKQRTMEIIRQLEAGSRGVYTGSIGYILPNQDFCFNVAIRSIVINQQSGELGIGGGLVYDSDPELEFEETKLKARFFVQALVVNMKLLESILYTKQNFYLLNEHLQRLKHSAHVLDFTYPNEDIQNFLAQAVERLNPNQDYKIRLILDQKGKIDIEIENIVLVNSPHRPSVGLFLSDWIHSSHPLLSHKLLNSDIRTFYQRARGHHPQFWDLIFVNERQELTESSIGNILIEQQGVCYTPHIDSGLLPGIMREHLLQTQQVQEKVLRIEDLRNAEKIYIINAVRGIQEVSLCPKSY